MILAQLALLAADSVPPAAGYLLTRFGAEEGNPALIINSIAQSRDGFLWIANASTSLVRFDGRSFYEIPNIRADQVAITPDGDLWVQTSQGGLTRTPAESLNGFGPLPATQYLSNPGASRQYLHVGRNGALWAGSRYGLNRFEHGVPSKIIGGVPIDRIEESANGHLQLITGQGYVEWDGSRIVPHPEIARQLGVKPDEIFEVFEDSRGVMWYCTALGAVRRSGDAIERLAPFGPKHPTYHVYEDPRGVVWVAGVDGLYRASDRGLEIVDPAIHARFLFGDRDGNLWIGTNGDGLIRLRERTTRMFTKADGLPKDVIMTVLVRHDGSVWTGANCGGLSRFDGQRFHTYTEKDGLLNTCVYTLAEDGRHDLWMGTFGGGAFHFRDGVFRQFSKQQGLSTNVVTCVLPARDGSVWFATPDGVSRLLNGQIQNYPTADGLPHRTFTVVQDGSGAIWAGNEKGIERFSGDRFVREASVPDGAVLVGELEPGRMYLRPGPTLPLSWLDHHQPVNVVPIAATQAIKDQHGDFWLCGDDIRRVPARVLLAVRAADEPAEYTMFGRADGVPSSGCNFGFPSEALGNDSKLWIGTFGGLAMLDLARMPKTHRQPAIYMGGITVGRNKLAPGRELMLPTGTNHVELRFSAVELTSPEKIRMQYRLDGVDGEWLDATPGVATYSNIPVGTHAFHVRSSNRDGIWDLKGIVYNVTQQPYFYETRLFQAASAVFLVLVLAGAYHLRVRQISAAMNARFDERLAERTRIARDFHDTLLQTIQGSKMVADDALDGNADLEQMRRTMERLSAWLGNAIREGREALTSLRSSTTERNDLAEALQRAGDECRHYRPIEFQLTLEGSGKEMHPIVRDEVYRIAYEAIRNASNHSEATLLSVELSYLDDLVLRVRDNGKGFEPTASKNSPGHFGLVGMYERAARLRGKLTISSSPGCGTQVELIVPRRVVFRKSGGELSQLRRLWRRLVRDE